MKRIAQGAAIALLMTGVGFAQTEQVAPDRVPPPGAAPATEMPAAPPAVAPDEEAGEFGAMVIPEEEGAGEEGRRRGRDGRGMDHHPGWRMHHPGAMGAGSQGAAFRFSRGEGGPSIMIRCAARDSTQECVDAIMPMLDRLLDLRPVTPPA